MSQVHLASDIRGRVRLSSKLRNIPAANLRLFCLDLALVVLGVRVAYLLDVFWINDPDIPSFFGQMLSDLRAHIPSTKSLVHVHEPASGQSFFVNRFLFSELSEEVLEKRGALQMGTVSQAFTCPSFIRLTDPLSMPTDMPQDVSTLIRKLYDLMNHGQEHSFVLSEGYTQEVLVPLAAVLLEYPVAYVPSSAEQSSFLSGTPLDVYECLLTDGASNRHQLLKFSCPSAIGSLYQQLASDTLSPRIKAHFQRRLEAANIEHTLSVTHHVETHERVAL